MFGAAIIALPFLANSVLCFIVQLDLITVFQKQLAAWNYGSLYKELLHENANTQ
jgi:hypothetical protein